ncbi:MAG TPA: transposase, partial [Bryobacteraceae bacterium]|nr:transposase [Bryobacteraceae bacterium]
MHHRLLDEERGGPRYLRIPAVAQALIASIHKGVPMDYSLHAWVVMPNHVHLLLTPQIDPSAALRKLKGASAREANKLLGLTGQPFWQDESYDRLVRGQEEFARIESYILQNPVRARLAQSAEEYPWSSASGFGGLKRDLRNKTADVLADGFVGPGSVHNASESMQFWEGAKSAPRAGTP